MSRARQAREDIKAAMKDQHGGVYQAAAAARVHFTQVYAFLRGGSMSQENAGRLRSVVKADDATWADAFAPVPPDEAPAEASA